MQPFQNIPPPSHNTPLFNNYIRSSQNLPLPPTIYPVSTTIILCDAPRIYPSLPEYTPFQQMYMCDPPRIYLSPPEYTPFFKNYNMRRSQNLPFLHRIYPTFQQLEYYAPLPESTPPSQIYPPLPSTTICGTSRIYIPLHIAPFSTNVYVRPSQNLSVPPIISPPFSNWMRHWGIL